MKKSIPVIFFSFISLVVFGRNIYVDNGGDDVTNNGSVLQPYRTINKAALEAIAGDSVIIKAGTYTLTTRINVANSGSINAPITFVAEVAGTVIINGINSASPTTSDRLGLFHIQGTTTVYKSYIIVDGLSIVNSKWAGFFCRYANNIVFKNCSTLKTGASGIIGANSSEIKILNNEVKEACNIVASSQNTNECITLASVAGFEIANNTVSDRMVDVNNGGEGIDAKNECSNGSIHHNTLFNLIRVAIYVDAYQRNVNNIDVYANKVYDCRSGITVASEEGGIASNVFVHDNLVYNIGRVGIRIAGYLNNGPLQNIYVYQNTLYNCGSQGIFENAGILLEASNPANFNFVIRNNIVSGCPQQIKSNVSQPFAVTIDNNLFFGNIGSFSPNTSITNTINSNPLHINAAANNFLLQPNSPAINVAVGSPLSTRDYNGILRPQGTQGDLGAFEFVASLPARILSFSASIKNKEAQINWVTTNEVNVAKFILQKSINGYHFKNHNSIEAKNLHQENSYSLTDTDINEKVFYRLKMMDKDGSFQYSKVIKLTLEFKGNLEIKVFPNPVTNELVVQHPVIESANQQLKIITADGRVVMVINVLKNSMQTNASVDKLLKGKYFLVFEMNGLVHSTSFIK